MRQPTITVYPHNYISPVVWQEVRAALQPTPIPQTSYDSLGGGGHRSAWSTWFEVAHPLAPFNRAMEVRQACCSPHPPARASLLDLSPQRLFPLNIADASSEACECAVLLTCNCCRAAR